ISVSNCPWPVLSRTSLERGLSFIPLASRSPATHPARGLEEDYADSLDHEIVLGSIDCPVWTGTIACHVRPTPYRSCGRIGGFRHSHTSDLWKRLWDYQANCQDGQRHSIRLQLRR